MELIQHMVVHSLALLNTNNSVKLVKRQFEEGTEFCMQTMVDTLQQSVNPKSKKPTHFIDNFYATFGYDNNKVVLNNYYFNQEAESSVFNLPIDFNSLFSHNQDTDLDLLKYACEHLFYDRLADYMSFYRLSTRDFKTDVITVNDTGEKITIDDFLYAKKYLNILLSRRYLKELAKYGIFVTDEVISNWTDAMNRVFDDKCAKNIDYLKGHLDMVFDLNKYPDELLINNMKKFASSDNLYKEIKLQQEICADAIELLWNSKNKDELKTNMETIVESGHRLK